jgi:L-asparagine transporter-like permease
MNWVILVYLLAGLYFAILLSKVGEASPERPASVAARAFVYTIIALGWPLIVGWLLATTRVEKMDRL